MTIISRLFKLSVGFGRISMFLKTNSMQNVPDTNLRDLFLSSTIGSRFKAFLISLGTDLAVNQKVLLPRD